MESKEILINAGLTALSIGGFYMLFHLLFNKGHHFQFNRFFILVALLFSFAFPFISFDLGQNTVVSLNQFQPLEGFREPINGGLQLQSAPAEKFTFQPVQWLIFIYSLGALLFLARYVIKLLSIFNTIRRNEKIKFDSFTLIKLKEGSPTFSFGGYVFSDQLPDQHNRAMFDHEKCHVAQKHTHDLLLVELLLALQWFNPFIYLLKNKLVEIHEFLADENVLNQGHDRVSYMKLLGVVASGHFHHQLTSSFHSNILKRIKMISINNLNRLKIWKTVFPFFFGVAIVLIHSGFKHDSYHVHLLADHIAFDNYLDANPTFNQPIKKQDLHRVASGYGMRMHPILKYKKMHNGIDYAANEGVPILASSNGVVREAKYADKYGNRVIIDHSNGFSSLYCQMQKMAVNAGDKVTAGQVIGTVGNTGLSTAPHLHFEIMKDGEHVNPEDYLEPYQ